MESSGEVWYYKNLKKNVIYLLDVILEKKYELQQTNHHYYRLSRDTSNNINYNWRIRRNSQYIPFDFGNLIGYFLQK